MIKHNLLATFLKKTNSLINRLLKKYLNKFSFIDIFHKKKLNNIKFNNFFNIAQNNKIIISFVALIILLVSYLSIPNIYDKDEINKQLKNQLFNKLSLEFNFSPNLKYNFFPRPHFIFRNITISYKQKEISKIKRLKVFVSLKNLLSLESVRVNNLILENANFNLNNQNYNLFIELLSQNYKDGNLEIKDSNIFFRNEKEEVLFINKISKMKYYYDFKNLRNITTSKNEIFKLPYSIELSKNNYEKKIFSKLNLIFLKLQITNEIDHKNDKIEGFANLILKKKKSKVLYELKKNSFNFNLTDKLNSENYSYEGDINFNPFYANLDSKIEKIDLNFFFNTNALIPQLFKSEILNNENLDFKLNIIGNKIKNYENFKSVFLKSKIKEGLIDFDNTKFSWKTYANFKVSQSLMFVRDNELVLDGKLDIEVKDSSQIYKFLLTPKNYRTEIKKIELNFNYNFDQKILGFSDIKINDKINANLNNNLKRLIFKNDKLQNNIYFKNKINKAIKSYAG